LTDPDANGEGGTIEGGADAPRPTVCGDGKKEGNEECDDGNVLNGDGCSGSCLDTSICDACLSVQCPQAYADGLYTLPVWPLCTNVKGNATSGEAVGRPRKDLCQETYTCAVKSQCMSVNTGDPTPCYCGKADTAVCLSGGAAADGPCKKEIDNGMETTDVAFLLTNMINAEYAAGAALAARRCAADLCSMECAPNPPKPDGGLPDGGLPDGGATDGPNSQ
jgi:cysteine-rich repeat protein